MTKRLVGLGAGALAAATLLGSGTAAAVFPDFTGCQTAGAFACIDIQSRDGSMTIKGTTVPIGESLAIRGALSPTAEFIPPAGTTGIFSRPIQVPGGLLGIDFPIPGNAVTATTELAGPVSSVRINPGTLGVAMPIKLKLSNPILGPWCHIGSNSDPANLNMIIGTTNPPPPNTPISGRKGRASLVNGDTAVYDDNVNVDNSFAVPGASVCGIGLGLVNTLINAKLQIPSAAGNNTLIIVNDVALKVL
ncbi:hypothetical protein BDZ31_001207 [Conexibacter arvalis]|uniref:Secreted protein n=1 Tax=Conexibacter arvalis TaxID=912552 RepID=A0A840IC07_9ACTN|nr:hypothetical protein [Conexibacter arvalis]